MGIISRDQAEILLQDKPTGSFLVRVSERIWGYTVSYVVGDGTFKHFLVERIPEGYQFLGTNQVVHDQLFDLISYHETAPITAKGGEILKWSVGQMFRPPDYHDIVPDTAFPQMNRLVGRF
ncbi:SH2 domain protein [Ancylostoma caninum]|uniref:SH2 domain protein n=1 Tax=Ancylostoma caninum TaxID=29170 RepID=A0A368EY52_ANCCA|nr:SH2 domain protein [Ancylostoma caninum]